MFDILKKKLSNIVEKVTKKVVKKEKEVKEKPEAKPKEKVVEKKPAVKGIAERIVRRVTERKIIEDDLTDVFEEVELDLLEADVAVEVIDKIKEDLRKNLVGKDASRAKVKEVIERTIHDSLLEVLEVPQLDVEGLIKQVKKESKPVLITFLGFNGSGKTTTLAKMANWLMNKKYSVVFAAADSFRAASYEQLEEHANRLKVKMIKHQYGSDPTAIVFDAVKHAQTKGIDVVLADTAGRSHTNRNLIEQLQKIVRVNKPDLKILVLDSMTGNDIINQCRMFDEAVGVDALILTKNDVAKKGGSILSAAYVLKKPILFLGTGQEYKNFEKYEPKTLLEKLI